MTKNRETHGRTVRVGRSGSRLSHSVLRYVDHFSKVLFVNHKISHLLVSLKDALSVHSNWKFKICLKLGSKLMVHEKNLTHINCGKNVSITNNLNLLRMRIYNRFPQLELVFHWVI